jgi:hypothetical protein
MKSTSCSQTWIVTEMAVERPQSSRLQSLPMGLMASLLRRFAEIGAAAKHFLRPSHPLSFGKPAETAAAKQDAVAVSMDVSGGSDVAIKSVDSFVPDNKEIERRRNLVRTLFNDFWSGTHEKPAAFVERLDQAQDYVNERLTACGESWQLNNETRTMLSLPSTKSKARPS